MILGLDSYAISFLTPDSISVCLVCARDSIRMILFFPRSGVGATRLVYCADKYGGGEGRETIRADLVAAPAYEGSRTGTLLCRYCTATIPLLYLHYTTTVPPLYWPYVPVRFRRAPTSRHSGRRRAMWATGGRTRRAVINTAAAVPRGDCEGGGDGACGGCGGCGGPWGRERIHSRARLLRSRVLVAEKTVRPGVFGSGVCVGVQPSSGRVARCSARKPAARHRRRRRHDVYDSCYY